MTEADARIVSALHEQLAERRRLVDDGAARVGWKAALGIEEVENRPVIGYLTSVTQLPSGAAHSAAGAAELCVDAELAVEVGCDGAIARYAAALELVDLGQGRGGVESVLRANVLHRAFVLGPSHDDPVREARVYLNDELRAEGVAEFDLEERTEVVAYWLSALGEHLEPGDRIITGSIVQVAVAPGDEIAVDIGNLGRLKVSIVE
jgi:2-keto-4-pentenoate hydratase